MCNDCARSDHCVVTYSNSLNHSCFTAYPYITTDTDWSDRLALLVVGHLSTRERVVVIANANHLCDKAVFTY